MKQSDHSTMPLVVLELISLMSPYSQILRDKANNIELIKLSLFTEYLYSTMFKYYLSRMGR